MGNLILSGLLVAAVWFVSYTVIKAFLSFAPWVPTFSRDVDRIFALADLKPGEIFLDLGSGNGRMPIMAAKRYGALGWGVELVAPLFLVSLLRKWLNPGLKLHFSFADLFTYDLGHADVIYVYGLPDKIVGRLSEKIAREAKPRARIISYCFQLDNLKLIKEDRPDDNNLPIYLYQKYEANKD